MLIVMCGLIVKRCEWSLRLELYAEKKNKKYYYVHAYILRIIAQDIDKYISIPESSSTQISFTTVQVKDKVDSQIMILSNYLNYNEILEFRNKK